MMNINNNVFVVLVACLFIPLCLSAPQNILFGTQAATLVGPAPPTLVLQPLSALPNPYQTWNIANGFITSAAPGYTNYVFDVTSENTYEGAPVGLWTQKTPTASNQQWTVQPNGAILSQLAPNFYLAGLNGGLVGSYNAPPAVASIQTPVSVPWVCTSCGDPHISPFSTGRNDLLVPGSQSPGTYTLSRIGTSTDPDFTLVQADQQLCRTNVPGVYCNQRVVVQAAGQVVQIAGDTVTVNGAVTTVTGTYTVGNGVTITKLSTGNYMINYPNGYVQSTRYTGGAFPYTNIVVGVTGGSQPTGGVCTQYVGGAPPSRKRTTLTPAQFVLTWRANNYTSDLFNYSSQLAWLLANPTNFTTSYGNWTTTNTSLSGNATLLCAPLLNTSTLVQQCAGLLPQGDFHQACIDDVIAMQDYGVAASIIDGYSAKCSKLAPSNVTIALPTSAIYTIASGPGLTSPVPLSSPATFIIQTKNSLGTNTSNAGDSFTISSTGPASLVFAITYLGNGQFSVQYNPTVAGTYSISIIFGGNPIANSPYAVTAASAATDPSHSTASGPGLGQYLDSGSNYVFTIQARTSLGTARTVGGDTVTVTIGGYAFPNPIVPVDNKDGTYTVTYQQEQVGSYQITVKINNVQISGSPFTATTVD
jgi:hypothetical protein